MSTNPLLPNSRLGQQALEQYGGFGPAIRDEVSFSDVGRVLRRQRRVILYCALGGLILALLVSLVMTPKYRSLSHVELNPGEGNKLGLSDFNPDASSTADDLATNLATFVEMLRSDSLALETIQQNNLESFAPYNRAKAKYPAEASLPLAEAGERRTAVLKKFQSNLTIKPVPGTRVVLISFDDRDRKRSAAVVNSLIANYTTDYIHRHYLNSVQTSDWLQKQIGDMKQQVSTEEGKVLDFEKKNGFFGFVGTGADNSQNPMLQKLILLNQTIVQAQSDRIQKEAIAKLLNTRDPEVIVGLGSSPQIATGVIGPELAILQNLRLQEAQLKSQYSDMSLKYGPKYPTLIETKNQLDSVQSSIAKTVDNLRSRAQNDYTIAAKNEAMLKASFDDQAAEANKLNDKVTQFQLLSKEAEASRALYEGLLTKLREAEVAANVRGANITVVDQGLPMPRPDSPNYLLNLPIGLVGGLLIGLGTGFFRSRGDQALDTVEAIEAVAPVAILGAVPTQSRLKQSSTPQVILNSATKVLSGRTNREASDDMLVNEAYRQIRTSILMNTAGAAPRTILITSPLNGDGKSSTVAHLATTFAQSGAKVLALDCDLRRPEIDGRSGESASKGLSDLLAYGGNPDQYIQPDRAQSNLFYLSSGSAVDSPLLLVESPRFKEVLNELKRNFDFVLIDSPPVSFFADVSVISPLIDATVMVVRAGTTSKQSFRRSCRTLVEAGGKLLGVIVNDLPLDSSKFYAYYGYRGKDIVRTYAKV